MGAGKIAGV